MLSIAMLAYRIVSINALGWFQPNQMSQGRSTRCIGDGKPPTFNRESGNPYNGYINPYYWVDDHPLLYGNNGSLEPIMAGQPTPPLTYPPHK